MLRNFDFWTPRVFCLPADDSGGGGDPSTNPPKDPADDPEEKKFSQKEFDEQLANSMKRWRKGLQKDSAEKEAKLSLLQQELEGVKKDLEEKKVAIAAGKDKTMEGQLEILQRKHHNEIEELNKKLGEIEKARESAEKKAFDTRRDNEIYKALEKAGCIDLNIAYPYILRQIEFDVEDEVFLVNIGNGKQVRLEEGVKELLPDYLKRPVTTSGGSGSKTGTRSRNQKATDLEEKKRAYEVAKKSCNPRRNDEVANVMKLKKEVLALEAELNKAAS